MKERAMSAAVAALILLSCSSLALAAKKPQGPKQAENIRTVFIEKGSADKLVQALNALHAKMEAEGWIYQDLGVYTEDGDLEGLFVTYLKPPPPPPPPPAPAPVTVPAPTPAPVAVPALAPAELVNPTVPAESAPPADSSAPTEIAPAEPAPLGGSSTANPAPGA